MSECDYNIVVKRRYTDIVCKADGSQLRRVKGKNHETRARKALEGLATLKSSLEAPTIALGVHDRLILEWGADKLYVRREGHVGGVWVPVGNGEMKVPSGMVKIRHLEHENE